MAQKCKQREGKCTELAEQSKHDYGIRAQGMTCNVADPESVRDLTRSIIDSFGKIEVLFNNAASKSANLEQFFTSVEDYVLEEWRNIMSVNLDGMFLVA